MYPLNCSSILYKNYPQFNPRLGSFAFFYQDQCTLQSSTLQLNEPCVGIVFRGLQCKSVSFPFEGMSGRMFYFQDRNQVGWAGSRGCKSRFELGFTWDNLLAYGGYDCCAADGLFGGFTDCLLLPLKCNGVLCFW